MNKFLGFTAVLALLAACDQRPSTDVVDEPVVEDPEDPTEPVITSGRISVGSLESATMDGDNLVISILLDGTDDPQIYTFDAGSSEGSDYDFYTQQESDINRSFTAIAGENPDGSLLAVVAVDGGQFNRFFGGATIEQSGYSAPESGFYYYTCEYAGLLNFGGESAGGGDTPDSVAASDANPVSGSVYLLADFVDNNVEGVVYDRTATISGTGVNLGDVVLTVGDISDDGTFSGASELDDNTGIGSYSGAFDANAAYVAGIIALNGDFLADATTGTGDTETDYEYTATGFEQEYGIFVIGQCPSGPESCFGGP